MERDIGIVITLAILATLLLSLCAELWQTKQKEKAAKRAKARAERAAAMVPGMREKIVDLECKLRSAQAGSYCGNTELMQRCEELEAQNRSLEQDNQKLRDRLERVRELLGKVALT